MMAPLGIVTGASTGIGFELGHIAAEAGYDLIIAANEPLINDAAQDMQRYGRAVQAVEIDLASSQGVDALLAACGRRPVELLVANAGTGAGGAFADQAPAVWQQIIDTNVTGTLYLLQRVISQMIERGRGHVLVTGSIAGYIPGPFNAVYNATKAFIDNFTEALRSELEGSGVILTTLMPGPTDTEFFARANMLDTKLGADQDKADPAAVARDGWNALMAGRGHIVSGLSNRLQAAGAGLLPQSVLAQIHRDKALPGSAAKDS